MYDRDGCVMNHGKYEKYGNYEEQDVDSSRTSKDPDHGHPIIPPRGDYHYLLSFQKAEVVYDITSNIVRTTAHRQILLKNKKTLDEKRTYFPYFPLKAKSSRGYRYVYPQYSLPHG